MTYFEKTKKMIESWSERKNSPIYLSAARDNFKDDPDFTDEQKKARYKIAVEKYG